MFLAVGIIHYFNKFVSLVALIVTTLLAFEDLSKSCFSIHNLNNLLKAKNGAFYKGSTISALTYLTTFFFFLSKQSSIVVWVVMTVEERNVYFIFGKGHQDFFTWHLSFPTNTERVGNTKRATHIVRSVAIRESPRERKTRV